MPKKSKILTALLLASAILNSGCSLTAPPREQAVLWGQADATEVDVNTKVPGRLVEVYVKEGSLVRKGDRLAQIDAREQNTLYAAAKAKVEAAKAACIQAQANLEQAQRDINRYEELYQRGAVSQATYESYRSRRDVLAAVYEQSEATLMANEEAMKQSGINLGEPMLYAPFNGIVPTKYFRSANSLPRERSLYSFDGELYIKSAPVKEITDILSPVVKNCRFSVSKAAKSVAIPASLGSAFNISLSIDRASSEAASFSLVNNDGDTVIFTLTADSFAVDRTKSGKCDFSDEFACVTSAPINSTAKMVSLSIYVDNSSIEVFGDNGRFVLTNLVFPQSPFNKMVFASQKGKFKAVNLSINKINL